MILKLAETPYRRAGIELTTKETLKVAVRLIEMVSNSNSTLDLDLRLYTEHALPAFAQAKNNPGMSWEDLLQAKLLGTATTIHDTQVERSRRLEQIAQKIHLEGGTTNTKIGKWKRLTGLGQAMYFRHLKAGHNK
jgi:hypothetical protein